MPAAGFQPPVVIFQPPDLSEPRSRQASGGGSEPGDDAPDTSAVADLAGPAEDDAGGRPSRRRTRSRGGSAPAADDSRADAGEQAAGQADDAAADHDAEAEAAGSSSRRRRRGGRGRGRGAENGADGDGGAKAGGEAEEPADDAADQAAPDEAETADGSSRSGRRRRRRQRGGGSDGEKLSPDDPPDTVVHVRQPRQAATDAGDVRSIKGSTRLEAKRQRRREGRDSGRRRPPVVSEAEFLARREAVERVMVVRQRGDRTQIAVLEDGILVEHYVDKASHQSYVGNVYLGRVQNVLPSMEAAFVDIGKGRNAVLYAGEVNFDASGLEGVAKRIESALKSGQSILVQVTKDPIGHKGARLTSQVSLPGRYLVYVPGASMTGISRKLPDTERTRLKQILKQVMPENAGVIVRTAAEGASEEELAHDVSRLAAQWEAIERKAKTATAPELLYSEPDLTLRVVRDIFNEDFTKLVISGDSDWALVDEYVRYVAPGLAERMERWSGDGDVFAEYRIDEQIAKALERKVWLPSGGSLVIDTTEAMTVIDVNTGKFTGQGGNLEQTVTRNNLEAAEEVVRQLRLRDVGGIIVIDFIDMVLESNRDLVLRRLIECLARDRTKHQVAEVTSLGLVQMTRKRVGSGLLEAFSVPCEHCNGRGVLVSLELTDHAVQHGRGDGERRGRDERGAKEPRSGRGGRRGKDSASPAAAAAAVIASAGTSGPAAAAGAGPADDETVTGSLGQDDDGREAQDTRQPETGVASAATRDTPPAEPTVSVTPRRAERGRTRVTRPAGKPAALPDEPPAAGPEIAVAEASSAEASSAEASPAEAGSPAAGSESAAGSQPADPDRAAQAGVPDSPGEAARDSNGRAPARRTTRTRRARSSASAATGTGDAAVGDGAAGDSTGSSQADNGDASSAADGTGQSRAGDQAAQPAAS